MALRTCHLCPMPTCRRCCVCGAPTCSSCTAPESRRCTACPDPGEFGLLALDAISDWLEGQVLEAWCSGSRSSTDIWNALQRSLLAPEAPAVFRLGAVNTRDAIYLAYDGIQAAVSRGLEGP